MAGLDSSPAIRRAVGTALGLLIPVLDKGFAPETVGPLLEIEELRDLAVRGLPGAEEAKSAPPPHSESASPDSGSATPDSGSATPDAAPATSAEDAAAAEHYAIFEHALHPYASSFLDPEGGAGGAAAEFALRAYAQAGFDRIRTDRAADHLVTELEFVRFLSGSVQSEDLIARFLDAHLLGWLPAFVHAIRREPASGYPEMLDAVLEMVIELRRTLGAEPTIPVFDEVPDTLSDSRAGVSEVARHLCTHAWTGVFVGRETVGRWARSTASPRGFGGRALMLGNLLRSAASYDALPAVIALFRDELAGARSWWRSLPRDVGSMGAWADHWEARAVLTEALLDRLSEGSLSG